VLWLLGMLCCVPAVPLCVQRLSCSLAGAVHIACAHAPAAPIFSCEWSNALRNTLWKCPVLPIWGAVSGAWARLISEGWLACPGEMESEWAGTPARVIRERYRRAADIAKVRGKCAPAPRPAARLQDLPS